MLREIRFAALRRAADVEAAVNGEWNVEGNAAHLVSLMLQHFLNRDTLRRASKLWRCHVQPKRSPAFMASPHDFAAFQPFGFDFAVAGWTAVRVAEFAEVVAHAFRLSSSASTSCNSCSLAFGSSPLRMLLRIHSKSFVVRLFAQVSSVLSKENTLLIWKIVT